MCKYRIVSDRAIPPGCLKLHIVNWCAVMYLWICVLWESCVTLTFVMCLQLWEGINRYFAQGAVEKLLGFLFLWFSWGRAGCWGWSVGKPGRCRIRRGVTDSREGGGRGWHRRAQRGQARTFCVCWVQRRCWRVTGGQRWLVGVETGMGVICEQHKVLQVCESLQRQPYV